MQEVEVLRKHCDEVQQRSMKGNLIISSRNTQQRKSLLRPQAGLLQGDLAKEDATSLCCRLIELKTGIRVPKEDISACHILKGQGENSSYIIRFHNLKPGSSWEALTAGLMTGKVNGISFTDANVFINYQVTRERGQLLKLAREARRSKSIHKYSTDQNGNISIQSELRGKWNRITSPTDLDKCKRPQQPAVQGDFHTRRK